MIKSKKCSVVSCNNSAFSKGFCQIHSPKKEIKKSSGFIKKSSGKKTEVNKEKQDKRNTYFEYHLERCQRSEESFKRIDNPTRANICHILPKSTHPSLQDNLENCMLYTFEEHEMFDKLLFSLEFEKLEKEFKNSWDKVCIKIKKLLPLSKESTNLSRALEKYLDGREIKG